MNIWLDQVTSIGHVILKYGTEVDSKKIKAVLNLGIPMNVSEDIIDDMLKDLEMESIENLMTEMPVNIVDCKVKQFLKIWISDD